MKKIVTTAVLFCFAYLSFAGQNIIFSQYGLNLNTYNPAAAGCNDMINVFGTFRSQYAGLEGAPMTFDVAVDASFDIANTKHGVGLSFYDNSMGLFVFQDINLQYAYRHKIGEGYLSGGFFVNFTTLKYDTERIHNVESDYHSENDPAIPKSEANDFKMDIGVGFLYRTKDWYAGISALNLLAPEYSLSSSSDLTLFNKTRNLFLMGGYNISFTNPLYKLKLSALVNTDFISWTGLINANFEYKEMFWGGLGYRIDGAVIFTAGVRVLNGLVIAYSYDLPTSGLINSAGGHEVVVSYSFNIDLSKKNKYKSIRYL
jgi:type IX secretion system PorP/SprF family membrane protein